MIPVNFKAKNPVTLFDVHRIAKLIILTFFFFFFSIVIIVIGYAILQRKIFILAFSTYALDKCL